MAIAVKLANTRILMRPCNFSYIAASCKTARMLRIRHTGDMRRSYTTSLNINSTAGSKFRLAHQNGSLRIGSCSNGLRLTQLSWWTPRDHQQLACMQLRNQHIRVLKHWFDDSGLWLVRRAQTLSWKQLSRPSQKNKDRPRDGRDNLVWYLKERERRLRLRSKRTAWH